MEHSSKPELDMPRHPKRDSSEYFGLKWALKLLPVSLLNFYFHQHRPLIITVGLILGIALSQIVPPRQSVRAMVLGITAAILLGVVLATFPTWNW